jgi:hypothetical protein
VTLSKLRSLRQLVSIEVLFFERPGHPIKVEGYLPSFKRNLNRLSILFPSLRRVFIGGSFQTRDIWTLLGTWEWKSRDLHVIDLDLVLDREGV